MIGSWTINTVTAITLDLRGPISVMVTILRTSYVQYRRRFTTTPGRMHACIRSARMASRSSLSQPPRHSAQLTDLLPWMYCTVCNAENEQVHVRGPRTQEQVSQCESVRYISCLSIRKRVRIIANWSSHTLKHGVVTGIVGIAVVPVAALEGRHVHILAVYYLFRCTRLFFLILEHFRVF